MSKHKYRRKSSYMDPVLSRGIISILLSVLAILIILSFFEKAGVIGVILNDYILSFLFGAIRFTAPAIILILAWFVMREMEYEYRSTHLIGAVLFFLAASSLFHVGLNTEEMWRQALAGHGGGLFGMPAWLLKNYLGSAASIIILIALVLVSILLIFNTAITRFILIHKKLFAALGFAGKSLTNLVKTLFVAKKNGSDIYDGDVDENYESEVDDEENEDSDTPTKRRFFSKNIGEEKDAAAEGGEADGEIEKTAPAEKKQNKNAIDQAAYMQNVIIKNLPPLSLLSSKKGKPTSGDIKENAEIIKDTFRQFKINVDVEDIRIGPSVTQYSVRPAKGVKLSRITALSNNLSLNLAAHPIRIEAPIPGKSLVGIEMPNEKIARVTLKELLLSKEFKERPHNMMLALGTDVAGKSWFIDLTRMPHLLIAGATGSGKTVCINTILLSLLYQNTAETLRMILVDPKRVELTSYDGIPHLLTPVITNTQKTINALRWTISEMERRFEILSQAGNRDIHSYNKQHPNNRLPHIIFVIDELADLMATAANQVEPGIIRLAQMARAVGIYLILATQRPSVDVITGLMKANIPGRIAFSVASLVDSRTILDMPGAEKLLGRGDMLLLTAELSKPIRIQGAFISEEELQAITKYLTKGEDAAYDESIVDKQNVRGTLNLFGGPSDDQDPLFNEAKQSIFEAGKASASFLQRKLKIGYARAARILDELEEAGIIGPADGAKPREILVTEVEIDTDTGRNLNVFNDDDEQPSAGSNQKNEENSDEEIGNNAEDDEIDDEIKNNDYEKKDNDGPGDENYNEDVTEETETDVEEESEQEIFDKDENKNEEELEEDEEKINEKERY
ncbi:MAG: DNA translocase FtsK 4TM domain-containing protein [Patescibacteria group bacterium]